MIPVNVYTYLHTHVYNYMIERLWVEVNRRVNYPVKRILVEMESAGDLMKHCVSWFTIEVLSVGIQLFVQSWNNHPIPGLFD